MKARGKKQKRDRKTYLLLLNFDPMGVSRALKGPKIENEA